MSACKVYGETAIACNGIESLLDKPTYCESASYNNLVDVLKLSMGVKELVRSDGIMVNIDSLRGKIVGLFFMSLTAVVNKRAIMNRILDLASTYNELSESKKGQFEIVWIAKVESEFQFDEYLKTMPWLAIPFTHSVESNRLCELAKIDGRDKYGIWLFNRQGELLKKNATFNFWEYGADWYPFTDERLKVIEEEDNAVGTNKSLENLLANRTRDFVIRNSDGKQVPISLLEDKVVGIYFCAKYDDPLKEAVAQQLAEVHTQLKERGKQFEVVMVKTGGLYCDEYPTPEFKSLPWYALPPNDSNRKRLVRIFDPDEFTTCLAIVGPRGSFVNNYGFPIVMKYGVDAYPFSRLSVAQMEKTKLEEVSLESVLTCEDKNYVIRMNGEQIPVSNLWGKTIVLVFTDFEWRTTGVVTKLKKWHDDITHKKRADFEVILVASDYDEKSFIEDFGQMSWFALPYNDVRIGNLRYALKISGSRLSVFGPNGKLLSMIREFDFNEKATDARNFGGKDLLKYARWELNQRHFWPMARDDDDKRISGVVNTFL